MDTGPKLIEEYLKGDYYEKPMFVTVSEDHPAAAFFILNDPVAQETRIRNLVQQGFMVRTRADANTQEAHAGNLSRFEAAKRSGAQLISTDYYLSEQSPDGEF